MKAKSEIRQTKCPREIQKIPPFTKWVRSTLPHHLQHYHSYDKFNTFVHAGKKREFPRKNQFPKFPFTQKLKKVNRTLMCDNFWLCSFSKNRDQSKGHICRRCIAVIFCLFLSLKTLDLIKDTWPKMDSSMFCVQGPFFFNGKTC